MHNKECNWVGQLSECYFHEEETKWNRFSHLGSHFTSIQARYVDMCRPSTSIIYAKHMCGSSHSDVPLQWSPYFVLTNFRLLPFVQLNVQIHLLMYSLFHFFPYCCCTISVLRAHLHINLNEINESINNQLHCCFPPSIGWFMLQQNLVLVLPLTSRFSGYNAVSSKVAEALISPTLPLCRVQEKMCFSWQGICFQCEILWGVLINALAGGAIFWPLGEDCDRTGTLTILRALNCEQCGRAMSSHPCRNENPIL